MAYLYKFIDKPEIDVISQSNMHLFIFVHRQKRKSNFPSYTVYGNSERSSCKVIHEEGLPNIWGKAQIFPHIYQEAVSHIWLCNCSVLNFLIDEEHLIFFFSVCICFPPIFTRNSQPQRLHALSSLSFFFLPCVFSIFNFDLEFFIGVQSTKLLHKKMPLFL